MCVSPELLFCLQEAEFIVPVFVGRVLNLLIYVRTVLLVSSHYPMDYLLNRP